MADLTAIQEAEFGLRCIIALDPHHDDDGAILSTANCATCIAKETLKNMEEANDGI